MRRVSFDPTVGFPFPHPSRVARFLLGLPLALTLGLATARGAVHSAPQVSVLPMPRQSPPLVPLFIESQDAEGRTRAAVCTGAVIAPRFVLTAAHCVRSFPDPTGEHGRETKVSEKSVHLEEDRWWGTGEIEPLRVHVFPGAGYAERPNFSGPVFVGDIAIVEFEEPVRIAGKAVPAARMLRVEGAEGVVGSRGWMSGFSHRILPEQGGGEDMRDRPSESELRPKLVAGVNSVRHRSRDFLIVEGAARDCSAQDSRVAPSQPAEDWSLCYGDSGSPYVDLESGRALGVATVIQDAGSGRRYSFYVNLADPEIQNFIRGVVNQERAPGR